MGSTSFGKQVRKARTALPRGHKLSSQAGLAKAVCVTRQYISAIELGEELPSLRLIRKIAGALKIPKNKIDLL